MTTGLGKKLTADVETAGAQAGTVGGAAVSKGVVKETEGLGSKLKGQFASFGPLLGVALGGALLKGSLDAFDTLEKSTKRLQIGFDAIHQPQALDGLTKWASDFADQTGILQADVEDFSGKLLNMGSGFFQKAGPEGLRLLEDMTKALEGMSAETGKSATMLMRSLGPAILNTPEKALPLLQKYGSLTDDQTAKIKKLTDAGKDQAATQLIINDLTGKYGNAAARSATPMEKLKEQWNKLEITLGGIVAQILPPLVSLLHALEPVLKLAADHAGLLLAAFATYKTIGFATAALTGFKAAVAGTALAEGASGAERLGASIAGIPGKVPGAISSLKSLGAQVALLAAAWFTVTEAQKLWNAQQGTNRANAQARAQDYEGLANTIGLTAIQTGDLTDKQRQAIATMQDLATGAFHDKGAMQALHDVQGVLDRRVQEGRISWDTYSKIVHETGLNLDVTAAQVKGLLNPAQQLAGTTGQLSAKAQAHADAVQNQAIELAKVQPLLKSTTSFFGHQITTLADLKSSWNDWRTQTASSLDFVGGAFDSLATKSGESVSKLQAGLDKSLASMKTFGANLHTIAQDGGRGAQELVQHLLALGPAGATMAQKLVDAGKEGRRGIEGDLGGALKLAKTESQQLEKALVGGFHQIARAIIIATTPVDKLAAKLAAFDGKTYTATVDIVTHYEQIGSPSTGPAQLHAPQIAAATGFHGLVDRPVTFLAGERGPERVDIGPASRDAGQIVVRNTLKVDRRHFLDGQDYELRFGGPG